ncbi:MAG: hypothetical protein HEEMFOPI_00305 [Holosporales bacterium]
MKCSFKKVFTISRFFKVLLSVIIFGSVFYYQDIIDREYTRGIIDRFIINQAKELSEFEKNETVFDEAVHDFICSDDYIKNAYKDKDIPEEIRFSNYKRIRSNPYYRKWVVDNYRVSQQDTSHLVDEIKMLPHIKIVSQEEQKEKNKKLFKHFLDAFFNKKKIYKIPHIHHRMWITSNENPVEIPNRTFKLYLETLKTFPKDWKHIFWCLDPNKIPKTVKALQECGTPVEIRSLKEMIETMPGKYLFDKLYEEKHYAIAGDLAKRYVLYKLGGLYSDIGVLWKKDPTEFVDTFDRIVDLKDYKYPDVSVLAYPPNSKIEKTFYTILDNYQKLSLDIRNKFKGYDIMKLTWYTTFKVLIDTESNENDKIFYWDHNEKFFRQWTHCLSWRDKGILGNKPITESTTEW